MAIVHARRMNTKQIIAASLGAVGLLSAGLSGAADIAAGQKKAQTCAMCHGINGIAQMPNTPHLAGQPATYLVEQLKNYRSGKRSNEIMNVIAKPLTDREIDDVAAWYASIRIEVKPE